MPGFFVFSCAGGGDQGSADCSLAFSAFMSIKSSSSIGVKSSYARHTASSRSLSYLRPSFLSTARENSMASKKSLASSKSDSESGIYRPISGRYFLSSLTEASLGMYSMTSPSLCCRLDVTAVFLFWLEQPFFATLLRSSLFFLCCLQRNGFRVFFGSGRIQRIVAE